MSAHKSRTTWRQNGNTDYFTPYKHLKLERIQSLNIREVQAVIALLQLHNQGRNQIPTPPPTPSEESRL